MSNRPLYHKLDSQKNVVPATQSEYVSQFANPMARLVAFNPVGGMLVSTVFLCLDHGFSGKPLFFETMIFDAPEGPLKSYQRRYGTYKEAVQGHDEVVELARNSFVFTQTKGPEIE